MKKRQTPVDKRPPIDILEESVEVEIEIVDEEFVANIVGELRLALDRYRYAFFNGDISDEDNALVIATVKRKINETVHFIDKGFARALSHKLFGLQSCIEKNEPLT